VSKSGAPIPWYTYPAIEFIEPRIRPDSGYSSTAAAGPRCGGGSASRPCSRWSTTRPGSSSVQPQLPPNAARLAEDRARPLRGRDRRLRRRFRHRGGRRRAPAISAEGRRRAPQALRRDRVRQQRPPVPCRRPCATCPARLAADRFLRPGPCYPYKNCTSFFFRDTRWLTGAAAAGRAVLLDRRLLRPGAGRIAGRLPRMESAFAGATAISFVSSCARAADCGWWYSVPSRCPAQVAEAAGLLQCLAHARRDARGIQRAVLVDARVDAASPCLPSPARRSPAFRALQAQCSVRSPILVSVTDVAMRSP